MALVVAVVSVYAWNSWYSPGKNVHVTSSYGGEVGLPFVGLSRQFAYSRRRCLGSGSSISTDGEVLTRCVFGQPYPWAEPQKLCDTTLCQADLLRTAANLAFVLYTWKATSPEEMVGIASFAPSCGQVASSGEEGWLVVFGCETNLLVNETGVYWSDTILYEPFVTRLGSIDGFARGEYHEEAVHQYLGLMGPATP